MELSAPKSRIPIPTIRFLVFIADEISQGISAAGIISAHFNRRVLYGDEQARCEE